MSAYTKVGEITEGSRQALLLIVNSDLLPLWERFDDSDRRYQCWTVSPTLMFVVIPPIGMVDRHRDSPAKGKRLNVVLQTNPYCQNFIACDGVIQEVVTLEQRGIYQFDATLEHWAVNGGTTDRIVLVETLP